jgi:hypothetical protein
MKELSSPIMAFYMEMGKRNMKLTLLGGEHLDHDIRILAKNLEYLICITIQSGCAALTYFMLLEHRFKAFLHIRRGKVSFIIHQLE